VREAENNLKGAEVDPADVEAVIATMKF